MGYSSLLHHICVADNSLWQRQQQESELSSPGALEKVCMEGSLLEKSETHFTIPMV